MQCDICLSSVNNSLHVERNHLKGFVVVLAVEHSSVGECIFQESVSLLYQVFHSLYILAQFIVSRSIHGSLHLYTVVVSVENLSHAHHVTVLHFEHAVVHVIYSSHRSFLGIIAIHSYRSAICII